MSRLINALFAKVDALGPHVHAGHFDLVDSDGYFMAPELWDDLIRPGMDITMTMWQVENQPSLQKPSTLPVRPTQPVNPEGLSQLRQLLKKGGPSDELMPGKRPRPAKRVHKDYNQPPQIATRRRGLNEPEGEQLQRSNY